MAKPAPSASARSTCTVAGRPRAWSSSARPGPARPCCSRPSPAFAARAAGQHPPRPEPTSPTCRPNGEASAWSSRTPPCFPHLSVAQNVVSRFVSEAAGPPRSPMHAARAFRESARWPTGGHARSRRRAPAGRPRPRPGIRPALLLLDEPLSALDQPTREDLREVLQELLGRPRDPRRPRHPRPRRGPEHRRRPRRDRRRAAPPDRASQPGRRRTRRRRRRAAARLVRTRTRHHTAPGSASRPASSARRGTPGHPGPRAHLLPARRRPAWHASARCPGRRQPYRADRAGAAYPAARPRQPGFRPARHGTDAAPRPRTASPATPVHRPRQRFPRPAFASSRQHKPPRTEQRPVSPMESPAAVPVMGQLAGAALAPARR